MYFDMLCTVSARTENIQMKKDNNDKEPPKGLSY